MTNINDFDPRFLSIDQVVLENDKLIMYDIKYIKDLSSLNSLYFVFNDLDAYIEESGENKYLIFASTKKNKIMFGLYKELWDEFKEEIELITDDKVTKYGKDFMNVRFKTNDDLPLNKIINIPVILSGIFKEDSEYHPQVLLHGCFYEYEENINPPVV